MNKKILLTLGSTVALAAPVVAVVSCSVEVISPQSVHKISVELNTSNTKAQNTAIVTRAREEYKSNHGGKVKGLMFELKYTFKDGSKVTLNSMQLVALTEDGGGVGDDIAQSLLGSVIGDRNVHLSSAHRAEVLATAPDSSLFDNS